MEWVRLQPSESRNVDIKCSGPYLPVRWDPTAVITSVCPVGVVADGGHVVEVLAEGTARRSPERERDPKIRYNASVGQMAGRSQRPTKLLGRLSSLKRLRGGMSEVYMTVHLHVNK